MYLKNIVSELKARRPNVHVTPSNGSETMVAFIPARTFWSWVLVSMTCVDKAFLTTMMSKIMLIWKVKGSDIEITWPSNNWGSLDHNLV